MRKNFNFGKKKDALIKLRYRLIKNFSLKKIEKIEKSIISEINKAFVFAENSKFPSDKSLLKDVYAKK